MERSCNFIKKTVDGNEKWFVSRGRNIGPEHSVVQFNLLISDIFSIFDKT